MYNKQPTKYTNQNTNKQLTVLAPIMKAKKSVKDVIVIEQPCKQKNKHI